jgi:NTP pyrophosphatase (non-canonical NTP hydrolase)
MEIKHTLASKKDKKCTILSSEMQKILKDLPEEIALFYINYGFVVNYHKSRDGKTYYANNQLGSFADMPEVGQPVYHDVFLHPSTFKTKTTNDLDLFKENIIFSKNEFEPIREWARNKGIFDKGDAKTQYIKLMEEAGELAKAILKADHEEFIDAIGDCVVVLTNLAELGGVKIEDCINSAYEVISKRTGKMENGTFVKDSQN